MSSSLLLREHHASLSKSVWLHSKKADHVCPEDIYETKQDNLPLAQ